MLIYTSVVGYRERDALNITAGTKHLLAPPWLLVEKYNAREIDCNDYTRLYHLLLRERREQLDRWVLSLRQESLTLLCYCPPGRFCHRVLAAVWLASRYRFIHYLGEQRRPK